MCDMQVVRISKLVLQPLQARHEWVQRVVIEQVPEQLDGVAQLLGGDPQLVSLPRRQPAEAFAAFAQVAPPSIEQARGYVADRCCEKSRRLGRSLAPCARFEPM